MDIFGETVELEKTSIKIHDNYIGIPDIVAAVPDVVIALAQPSGESTEQIQLTTGDSEQDDSTRGQ